MTQMRMRMGWVVCAVLLGLAGGARAEGVVQNAGKDAAKGAIKGAQQQLTVPDVTRAAKQVTKGMLDGVADEAPLLGSQMVNQANVNKKALGKVARQVTTEAMAGAINVTIADMERALGPNGDGPLANAMVGMTERTAAALVRGIRSEMPPVRVSPWTTVLPFIAGCAATFLCGLLLTLLYVLFQRRRVAVVEPVPAVYPKSATAVQDARVVAREDNAPPLRH